MKALRVSPPYVSSALALVLLLAGAWGGMSNAYPLPLRTMHLAIASIFLLLVPLMLYVHLRRFFVKGAGDWVAWTHFVLFAMLVFISIRMYRRWYDSTHEHYDQAGDTTMNADIRADTTVNAKKGAGTIKSPQIVRWRNKPLHPDKLAAFVNRHPGGKDNIDTIFKAKHSGKDLEEIWQAEGVGWHTKSPAVAAVLKSLQA